MATREFARGISVKNPGLYQRIYENREPEILVLYSDYRVKSANPPACSLFGTTEQELSEHFLTDLADFNDPRLINLIEVAESTGKTNGDITLVRKNGSKFTGEVNSSLFTDENGDLIIDVVIRELFDRRIEEDEWRKNFSLYQLAIDATSDGIWDMDMKTNRVFLSPNALNWLGYKGPKTLHRDELCDNIIYKDDKTNLENDFIPVINGTTNLIDIDFRVNTLTVGWKWIRLRGKVVLRDREGKVIRMLGTFADISNRKLLEKELERNHKEFQTYFDSASVGLTVATLDKQWIAVNEKACQMFGYNKEELLGLSWVDLVHPDDLQEHIDRYNLALEGKIDKDTFDTRLIRKDGRIIYVNLSIVCCRNEDGSVHHFLASHIDTTEQKKHEESIRNERKILRTLVDNLPFTVYVIDKEGRKVISNRADLETIVYNTEAEVIGKTDIELFPGETGERGHADNMNVINTGLPILNREEDFLDSNGQQKWLLTTKVPLFDANSQISGLIGIGIDITEQKSLQQKIIESEAYYRTLINIAPDGVIVTDLEGNVTFHSKKIFQIFEASENIDFIGESVFNWIAPDNLDEAVLNFKSVLAGVRLPQILAYKCLKYDKTEFWGELSSSPLLDISGKPKGLMLVCRDISDRKEAEEKLILALNKAEESDRLKSAFLTNMSHEIRTPMNGILGFAELLKEPTLTSNELQDYIQTIQISGARMLNTINGIVDMSKIESGLIGIDIKETNLNEKIELTYKFFKPEVEIKGLQFLFKNGLPTNEAIIKTDNEKVYAILTNLVRNAIKFTFDGSITFGYEKKGEYLEFFVKDTGIGIPQKQQQLIYERFRQGSESHNRGYEGSGLGLSISKSYVGMLGGRIWVDSEEGLGSTFYFTIPYNIVSEEKTTIEKVVSAEHKEVQLKNLKILIVEDDEISFSLLTLTLQKISKEVLHAITGVEAVEACRNNPDLDLVLMDIRMPQMNGLEATQQIRQFNKDVIIIAQTAYAFTGDSEKAVEAGCNDYISKPINKTSLYELIKKHVYK